MRSSDIIAFILCLEKLNLTVTNTSNKPFSVHPSKEALTLGEADKIQAAGLGIEPRASGYAHQCSDR